MDTTLHGTNKDEPHGRTAIHLHGMAFPNKYFLPAQSYLGGIKLQNLSGIISRTHGLKLNVLSS